MKKLLILMWLFKIKANDEDHFDKVYKQHFDTLYTSSESCDKIMNIFTEELKGII